MDKEETLTNKLLDFLEKDRFSLTSAIIYVFIIAGVRSLMEAQVGSYHGYGRYLFTQHVLLSYPQLLIGVLIIYLIIKKPPKKIMNVFLLGYGILLVPPIADYLIFGDIGVDLGTQYEYLGIEEILPALLNGWNPFYVYSLGSRGQGLMFVGLMFGSASYVALKLRLNQKFLSLLQDKIVDEKLIHNILQTIGTYFGIYLLMWFIGSFKAIIRLEADHYVVFNYFKVPFYTRYYIFFREYNYPESLIFPTDPGIMGLPTNLVTNQSRLIFLSFFIILAIISTLIILYISQRKRLIATLKNLPKMNIILFSLSAFIGIASIHMIDPDFSKGFAIDPTYLMHMPYIFLSLLVIALLTSFSYFVKRIYTYGNDDESILNQFVDDNLTKYHYTHLSASIGLTALYFSIILGYITSIISIIWILLCVLLTSEKENVFRDNLKITSYGILSYFIGFYTPNVWRSYIVDLIGEVDVTVEIVYRTPPITLQIFFVIIWIIISFWMIAKITSFDEKRIYLFSKLDDSKNQQLTLGIILILLLFPLILFPSFTGLFIFIGPAIATPVWYKILGKSKVISFGFMLQFLLLGFGFLYVF